MTGDETPAVLMVVDRLAPDDCGLFHAVQSLSAALARTGRRVDVLCASHPDTVLPDADRG